MITGLTGFSDRRHVVRAGLESIAYQLRDALDALQAESGVTLRALRADGGPTANRLLMQFAADITGTDLSASDVPDCSPLGAALMGMLGVGVHDSLASISKIEREDRVYRPAMPPEEVESNIAGWRRAVQQALTGTSNQTYPETNP
jgi:glycerol kinase